MDRALKLALASLARNIAFAGYHLVLGAVTSLSRYVTPFECHLTFVCVCDIIMKKEMAIWLD
jgi:hypothetical protein